MTQSFAKIYIHAFFSTENRDPVLADGWRDELFRVLRGTANIFGCQSLVVGGTADHVHMLFEVDGSNSIDKAIKKIKSTSSEWINQTRGLPLPFYWQKGYAAFPVKPSDVEEVREYISNQSLHHKKRSFKEELRELFQQYEINWDEQNVWD